MKNNYQDIEGFVLFNSVFMGGVKKKDISSLFGTKRIETENIISAIKTKYIMNKTGQLYILDLERNDLYEVIKNIVDSKSFLKCDFIHKDNENITNISISLLLNVISAIKEKKVLDVQFLEYDLNSKITEVRVDALYLLYIDNKWYLKSYLHLEKSLLLVPMSRIINCKLINKTRSYKLSPRPTYTTIKCAVDNSLTGLHKELMLKEFNSTDNQHVCFKLMKDEYFHYKEKYILSDNEVYSSELPYKCFRFISEIRTK